ncbi:FAD-binding oxidoreductase [Candidatus Saccharibacteria bacterium]|nr:FAD-binding oxidoreductase [Candidatus Saccharibacteria bacterium]
MGKVARYLNQLTVGNVFDAPEVLEQYSTDRSVLKIRPKYVALPESTEDIRKIMRFCHQLAAKGIKLPVTVWGSGLDEGGADLTNQILVSTEKMNRLLEADRRERLVRVQAGITLKELNTALSVNGLMIPVGGHDSETIGGLISNCPADDWAGKYGGITKYVERIEVVLPNGDILQTNRLTRHFVNRKAKEKTFEGDIYARLAKLTSKYQDTLKHIRSEKYGMYGYPTITQASDKSSLDLLPLFYGAQGTLGIITEVILRAIPIEKDIKRVVATFAEYDTAKKFLDLANSLKPRELDIYDLSIIKTAEGMGKRLSEITQNMDKGFVVFAKYDRKANSALRKLGSVRKVLPATTNLLIESSKNAVQMDELENSLISFLNQVRTGERVPVLTDFYLPANNIQAFLNDIAVLGKSLGLDLALFGSYSANNYSVRPRINLDDKELNKKIVTFLRTGAFIINRQGGSLTGGTPEGRIKALVTNSDISDIEKRLYLEIKLIFDRYNIMNPGIKLGADARFTLTHLRDSASKITV